MEIKPLYPALSGDMLTGTDFVSKMSKVMNNMEMAKMRMLVSILMDSPLYGTLTHEEKFALLFSLAKQYPALFNPE